uniref:3-hydroxyanthranilate 3,4-dioxygenase isoform X2 n=1 Tax=Petromyzon marinus TaxID=7757 RepID=A0AAJ7X313_PETMA|nr:3-hydroxyanthranilate 3,4-dioxygenase isoform X2 [Petromyzon marinus]
MELQVVAVRRWIEENSRFFTPPVCNKLMHAAQLKVMFVGGLNQREDYHIEEGEELFFQIKGDMCLKIMERGQRRDIHIKEGEMFLLPARVPHSPQRRAGTMGLVIERERQESELDGLRFFTSEQCRTRTPLTAAQRVDPPFPLEVEREVEPPLPFSPWLQRQRVNLLEGRAQRPFKGRYETQLKIYGAGQSEGDGEEADTWIWQMEGTSRVAVGDVTLPLGPDDSLLIPAGTRYQWKRDVGCTSLYLVQNPSRKLPYNSH